MNANLHPPKSLHRIVIIGGGAGGLELAARLGKVAQSKKFPAHITLVDQNFNHIWKPLLHEVAAGTLDTHHAEVSYLDHARNHGFHFRPGQLAVIDRSTKTVTLAPLLNQEGTQIIAAQHVQYDTLVIAIGSQANDYHTPGAQEYCHFIDDRSSAEKFNTALKQAILQRATGEKVATLSIVIVGAGATGVELAAEIHHMMALVANYDFPHLSTCLDLILIEGSERILAALPLSISEQSQAVLKKLGIQIITNALATAVDTDGITLQDGRYIKAQFKIWAAGIKAPSILKELDGLETNSIGQLLINPYLQTTRDEDIFALGDCAQLNTNHPQEKLTATAQVAHQQSTYLAKTIKCRIQQTTIKQPFRFNYLGTIVSLSRYNAFGKLGSRGLLPGWHMSGMIAKMNYALLYRLHQLTLHGFWHTLLLILFDKLHRLSKPPVKIP